MKIIVGWREAVIKKGLSFEYFSENRLFLGRDGYTLSIAFPLAGCPENISIFGHINRMDVAKGQAHFECAIIDKAFSVFGTLSVVKVSEAEVECQFSEGRCSQTATNPFEETYVSDLDLGAPSITASSSIAPAQAWKGIDDGACEVALPWVNEGYADVPNNWVDYANGAYSWDPEVETLSWQPYLIVIAKRICEAVGYEYDFSEWESSAFRHLIVCNSLPGSWHQPGYANVMPQWTVGEFFEKLELLMMCEFDFDHKAKSVAMRFSKNALAELAPVQITDVVDSYNVEVSQEDDASCEYIAAKRVAFKECSHSMWNYYSCDWFIKRCKVVKRYATLQQLINSNKRTDSTGNGQVTRVFWGEKLGDGYDRRLTTVDALLYAEDVDTYFVFRSIGTEEIGSSANGAAHYTQLYVLQAVNVFGSGSVDEDGSQSEEIEFVPVCVMDTYVSKDDDRGYMMYLNPSSGNSSSSYDDQAERPGAPVGRDPSEVRQPGPSASIAEGNGSKKSIYYDEICLAFWTGAIPETGKTPYPIVDGTFVTQNWNAYNASGLSMRIAGADGKGLLSELPQIDPTQKFKFSWLGSTIPNPRAIFHIKGKRYLCEKITATFTEEGMSQLLKGEFYPLVDEG